MSDNEDLQAAIDEAVARFESLTREEQADHRREQRISFVFGNLLSSGADVTKEEVARMVDGHSMLVGPAVVSEEVEK